jgi:hypothetical protein
VERVSNYLLSTPSKEINLDLMVDAIEIGEPGI